MEDIVREQRVLRIADINVQINNYNPEPLEKYGCLIPFFSDDTDFDISIDINDNYIPPKIDRTIFSGHFPNEEDRFMVLSDDNIYFRFIAIDKNGSQRTIVDVDLAHNKSYISLKEVPDDGSRYKITENALSTAFHLHALKYNVILVHASAIMKDEKGYLFVGKSGRGKSTHHFLWHKFVNGVFPINDDVPLVKIESNGRIKVFGSPWSGKTYCFHNVSAELRGVTQIYRANRNYINDVTKLKALSIITPCIIGDMKFNKEIHSRYMTIIGQIIESVPFYELFCTPTEEAVNVCKKKIIDDEDIEF